MSYIYILFVISISLTTTISNGQKTPIVQGTITQNPAAPTLPAKVPTPAPTANEPTPAPTSSTPPVTLPAKAPTPAPSVASAKCTMPPNAAATQAPQTTQKPTNSTPSNATANSTAPNGTNGTSVSNSVASDMVFLTPRVHVLATCLSILFVALL